jgi:hypothetical protein
VILASAIQKEDDVEDERLRRAPFFCESRLLQDANGFEQRRRRSNHCSSFRAGFGELLSFANPATNG